MIKALKYAFGTVALAAFVTFVFIVVPHNEERRAAEHQELQEYRALLRDLRDAHAAAATPVECMPEAPKSVLCLDIEYVVVNECALPPEPEVVSFTDRAYHGPIIDLPLKAY